MKRLACRNILIAAGLAASLTVTNALAAIGRSELQFDALSVVLVYPTDATAQRLRFGEFEIEVAPNAPVSTGRHQLIVLSHGTAGDALPDHALAATLAEAGYVVAQPLHVGDNYRDAKDAGPTSFQRRPQEVILVIDGLAAHPRWSEHLDLRRVGVHGMSAGGVTGLSLAGGQWSMRQLAEHCSAYGDPKLARSDAAFCGAGLRSATEGEQRQAQFRALAEAPLNVLPPALTKWHGGRSPGNGVDPAAGGQGVDVAGQASSQWDPRPDSRVAAVSLSVPAAALFSPASLARITIPVGVVRAERDEVLVPQFHTDAILRACSQCELLANLPDAGHFDLLDPWPEGNARLVAAHYPKGGLPNPALDPSERARGRDAILRFFQRSL